MATFTPPEILERGDVLTADNWNAVCNNATMMYQVPFAMYSNGTPTDMPTEEETVVTLDGNSFENYGWTISGNSLIVPENAMYMIRFRIGWLLTGTSVSTGMGYASLYHNGSSIIFGSTASFASTAPAYAPSAPVSVGNGLLPLTEGDELFIAGLQNSGVTLATLPTSAATAIEVTRFGSL